MRVNLTDDSEIRNKITVIRCIRNLVFKIHRVKNKQVSKNFQIAM